MERKAASSTTEVTVEVAGETLSRRPETLSAEEERVVRMRRGAPADRNAPLPRAAQGNSELEDELLLIEMQLLRSRMRAGKTQGLPVAPRVAAVTASRPESRTKSKIVRALRRKR
jgi:hypothetical protein